jgi:hypothetical protein
VLLGRHAIRPPLQSRLDLVLLHSDLDQRFLRRHPNASGETLKVSRLLLCFLLFPFQIRHPMLLSLDLLLSFFQLLLEVDSSRFDGAMLFGKRLDLGQGEGKLVSNGGEFGFDGGEGGFGLAKLGLQRFGEGECLFGDGPVLVGFVAFFFDLCSGGSEGSLDGARFDFLSRGIISDVSVRGDKRGRQRRATDGEVQAELELSPLPDQCIAFASQSRDGVLHPLDPSKLLVG